MEDNSRNHLQWVLNEIQKWEIYHNHKETMAWVSTAFYITGVISFSFVLANTIFMARLLANIGIILTFLLMLVFVNMQFRNRWNSADFQIGLMRYAALLCCNSTTIPKEPNFVLDEAGRYPDHIWKQIDDFRQKHPREQRNELLRIFLTNPLGIDDRWKTEVASYVLIVLATIISIISLWIYS
jgi:hypothetical protein